MSATTISSRTRVAAAWHALLAAIGAIAGLLPHVLHHAGLLLGAAVVTGTTGNVLFGVLGLLLSLPLLIRLHRRFGSWKAPTVALVLFVAMFSLSTFVIGPAITEDAAPPGSPTPTSPDDEHQGHHEG